MSQTKVTPQLKLGALIEADTTCASDIHPAKRFLLDNLNKKILSKIEVEDRALEAKSFELFSFYNTRGRTFEVKPLCLWQEALLESISFKFEKVLRPLENSSQGWLDTLASYGQFGPGASCAAPQVYAFKRFSSALTYSHRDLIVPYKKQCASEGLLSVEYERQRNFGLTRVAGAAVSFVPKDAKIYRMIATEPSLDMFFQLGLHNFLAERLEDVFGCILSQQEPINRRFAKVGSISGAFATIDSTSASDCLYLYPLVKCGIIPTWFAEILRTIKSPLVTYGDKTIEISMAGTMGCGFTFALMTLLFYCVVDSVYDLMEIDPSPMNRGVYGDDIICTSQTYDVIIQALELLGFVPNRAKSFNIGDFRESCGGDYLSGYNVRSLYIKRLTTVQHVCVAYNGLLVWCALHNIYLWGSLKYLFNLAKSMGAFSVPCDFPEDSGVYCVVVRYNHIDNNGNKILKFHQARTTELPVYSDFTTSRKRKARDGKVRTMRVAKDYGVIHPDGLVRCAISGRIKQNWSKHMGISVELGDHVTSYDVREVSAVDLIRVPVGWPRKRGWRDFVEFSMRIDINNRS